MRSDRPSEREASGSFLYPNSSITASTIKPISAGPRFIGELPVRPATSGRRTARRRSAWSAGSARHPATGRRGRGVDADGQGHRVAAADVAGHRAELTGTAVVPEDVVPVEAHPGQIRHRGLVPLLGVHPLADV